MLYKPPLLVVVRMSSRNIPFFFACFLAVIALAVTATPVRAQQSSQEIAKALDDAATRTGQDLETNVDRIVTAIETSTAEQKNAMVEQEKERARLARTPSIDYNILFSLVGVPDASAATSMITTSVMDGRYRELHLIKQSSGKSTLYRGGVDSTTGSLE